MAIVIKEVIVKTTVERKEPQWSQMPEDLVRVVKREVLAELVENSCTQPVKKNRKDR